MKTCKPNKKKIAAAKKWLEKFTANIIQLERGPFADPTLTKELWDIADCKSREIQGV
jgi:hypothetical protein